MGGSQREDDYERLKARILEHGFPSTTGGTHAALDAWPGARARRSRAAPSLASSAARIGASCRAAGDSLELKPP